MDPLSVISVVVSLTAKCMQAAKQLNDLRDKYRSAQIIIRNLFGESSYRCFSLSTSRSHAPEPANSIHSLRLGRKFKAPSTQYFLAA